MREGKDGKIGRGKRNWPVKGVLWEDRSGLLLTQIVPSKRTSLTLRGVRGEGKGGKMGRQRKEKLGSKSEAHGPSSSQKPVSDYCLGCGPGLTLSPYKSETALLGLEGFFFLKIFFLIEGVTKSRYVMIFLLRYM